MCPSLLGTLFQDLFPTALWMSARPHDDEGAFGTCHGDGDASARSHGNGGASGPSHDDGGASDPCKSPARNRVLNSYSTKFEQPRT